MPFAPTYDVPAERRAYIEPARVENENGRIGLLMLHGFMGSPLSSHPMANYLAEHGVSVHCPLLPGHGHHPDKLRKIPRQAWLDEAEEAFEAVQGLYDELFLMGHSMGTILGAHLCLQNPDPRGLIMLTPFYDVPDDRLNLVKYLRYVMTWFYPHKMRSMRKLVRERVLDFDPTINFDDPEFQKNDLPKVSRVPIDALVEMVKMAAYGRTLWPKFTTPSIIFRGGHDPAVKPGTIDALYAVLPGPDKKLVTFEEAGHEPMRPFDPAHKELWSQALEFIRQHSKIGLPAVSAT
ncbi:alpha/beta hydrolase [Candidatus Leptofilum sp.]|uniref:alpha/beta hydrolase n=1 Tax=Candidatus Leptofilum sp. TaxID=3241576 RepID=UPI003B5CAA95